MEISTPLLSLYLIKSYPYRTSTHLLVRGTNYTDSRLESQGGYENKERATQVSNGYFIGLKISSSDGDRHFYYFLQEVTELIKSKIKTVEDSLKKTRTEGVITENVETVKHKDDGSTVTYTKLYTDNNMTIISTFYRVAAQSEIKV